MELGLVDTRSTSDVDVPSVNLSQPAENSPDRQLEKRISFIVRTLRKDTYQDLTVENRHGLCVPNALDTTISNRSWERCAGQLRAEIRTLHFRQGKDLVSGASTEFEDRACRSSLEVEFLGLWELEHPTHQHQQEQAAGVDFQDRDLAF